VSAARAVLAAVVAVLVGAALLASTAASGAAHGAGGSSALRSVQSTRWPESLLLRQTLVANQLISGDFLFAMISRTTSPERGPYRLTRTDLRNGTVKKGPLFKLATIAYASGRLWVSGTSHQDATAVQVDAMTLRATRSYRLGRALPALPRTIVSPGPAQSVWLGSNGRLIRVNLKSGHVLARAVVPPGYVVSGASTDPRLRYLYVSFAKKMSGGIAGAAVVEYAAASGRELARNVKDVSYSVAGAGLTASADGVWASFRTGMLGATIHLRRDGLTLAPPPARHTQVAHLLDWPMAASTLYSARSLWIANAAVFVGCINGTTGRVGATERLSAPQTIELLAIDPARERLIGIDEALRVVEITPPAACW
jgi:hypothetical protein